MRSVYSELLDLSTMMPMKLYMVVKAMAVTVLPEVYLSRILGVGNKIHHD